MAEPTPSPALPSTADAAPYVPVAWTAVAAVVAAGLFAALLLALGLTAFVNKKPLLAAELLVLPVVAVVLSFAARRVIRNAEGTRTGERLADAAWWTAVVLGLGYTAYLFAISFAVRREAAAEAERWVGRVQKGEVEDAFYDTLPAGMRQGVARSDKALIRLRYRDELLSFAGTDLVRLAARNRGELTFAPAGVTEWSYKPGAIDCTFAGVVTCPEGRFPVLIPLKGAEAAGGEAGGGGRQWSVARPPNAGFVEQAKVERTGYGWLLLLAESVGAGHGKAFLDAAAAGGPGAGPYLLRAFAADGDAAGWAAVARTPLLQMAVAAPLGIAQPGANAAGPPADFFRLPGNVEPAPAQRDKFLAGWNAVGVFESGRRLRDAIGNAPDKDPVVAVTDAAVEVQVPVELPLAGGSKVETARGRLVVVCADPELLAELKRRKAAAAGEKPTSAPPADLERWATTRWRVARIESDLAPVSPPQSQATLTGPGGPGMGGP